MARVGDDVIVWLAPGDGTSPPTRTSPPGACSAPGTRSASEQNKKHTGYEHGTEPANASPEPANASCEPLCSHSQARTAAKLVLPRSLVHPRLRGLHPQSGPRRSEPPCFHPEARTTPKLVHPRSRGLPPQSEPRCSPGGTNLPAPTPGAHIPSHNTSTPTQKETLCSQLSTSA